MEWKKKLQRTCLGKFRVGSASHTYTPTPTGKEHTHSTTSMDDCFLSLTEIQHEPIPSKYEITVSRTGYHPSGRTDFDSRRSWEGGRGLWRIEWLLEEWTELEEKEPDLCQEYRKAQKEGRTPNGIKWNGEVWRIYYERPRGEPVRRDRMWDEYDGKWRGSCERCSVGAACKFLGCRNTCCIYF